MLARFRDLLSMIEEDYRSHGCDWTRPGFRSLAVHRFGVWRMTIRTPLMRHPFSILYRAMYRHCRNVYGIELPYSVRVGRRVVFEHQSGIVIHGATVIGDDCIIRQNCTLGIRSLRDLTAAPILKNGVQLGAGAVVLGRVTIGQHALIGANSVVLSDVPDHALAVGAPARVVARRSKPGLLAAGQADELY